MLVFLKISLVLSFFGKLWQPGVLSKDRTVWVDRAKPANSCIQGILKEEVSLFDLFGLACFANKNKNHQLPYSWFQTSQTGGQWYIDTSPLVFPAVSHPPSGGMHPNSCMPYPQSKVYLQVYENECLWVYKNIFKHSTNLTQRTTYIRNQCSKTTDLSCHRCKINIGVEKMNYIKI